MQWNTTDVMILVGATLFLMTVAAYSAIKLGWL